MTIKRGEIWLADLNPTRGSEQAGNRPILILQNDSISQFTNTFLAIPFTTNLRRASLPTYVLLRQGEGGLASDSVALCHQLRVLDKSRFKHRLGSISNQTLDSVKRCVLFTTGIV